jgi:hypothetical protein
MESIIMTRNFLQHKANPLHPAAGQHERERFLGNQNMMHITVYNVSHHTYPLIMPRNTRNHIISIQKVHGVKSKIPPKNTLSCFTDTPTKLGAVPFLKLDRKLQTSIIFVLCEKASL